MSGFNRAPLLVIWEMTRACTLACVHCRIEHMRRRHPLELSTEDGFHLIDQVCAFGGTRPQLVLTGGDPMCRPDLLKLVRYAAGKGVDVTLTPGGTEAATRARLRKLKDAGLARLAVGLDGPDASTHDAFRGSPGSHHWTMKVIDAALELDLPLQINSTMSRLMLPLIARMARRLRDLPIESWNVFFLVRMGRCFARDQVTPEQAEEVLNYLYNVSLSAPFAIRTIDAPQFQRVVWQRNREMENHSVMRRLNDADGFVCIDPVGEVYPSGSLRVSRGSIKSDDLVAIYRDDQIFRRLRNPAALMGKCGRCDFREICGGSRARAYLATGSLVAPDPLCAYDPGPDVRSAIPLQ